MKICFIGTHGSGKSSGATHLASLLKRQYPEKSVVVIEENVRQVSRILNGELNTDTFQKLAIVDQIKREIIESSLHDIVICDRTTIDPLVYASALSKLPSIEYVDLALGNMDTFDKIYYIRPDNQEQNIVNDGFRFTNKEVRNRIDDTFQSWIELHNLKNVQEIRTSEVFTFNYFKIT